MSSVVKDSEILTSIPETATARPVASATAAPAGDASARPQPVALEVAVTVNGARTVAGSDKREPFSESTKTVLIFGHGAVVRLSSSVAPGQLLFLTNEKTKKEVVCQVVKSKNYHNVSGYVELEFTEPVAGFWGMRFPSAGASSPTAQSSQLSHSSAHPSPVVAAPPKSSTVSPAIESKPAAVSANRPDTKLPAAGFPVASAHSISTPSVSAGQPSAPSQPNAKSVQPISPNVRTSKVATIAGVSGVAENSKPSNVVEIAKAKPAPETSTPAGKVLPTSPKSILDSDEVKIPSWLEPLARNAAAASAVLPEIAAKELKHHDDVSEIQELATTRPTTVLDTHHSAVTVPSFGGQLLFDESDSSATKAQGGSNKKFILGAVAAGLLVAIGVGTWYTRQTAGNGQTAAASAPNITADGAANSAQVPSQTQNAAAIPNGPSGTYTAVSTPGSTVAGTPGLGATNAVDATNTSPNANKKLATIDAANTIVNAVPPSKRPSLGPVNLSAPIVNRSAASQDRQEEALNLGASSLGEPGGGLSSGLAVSNSRQPVAPAVLPVGGDVKTARLISSVAPVYPTIAKAQRVGGNVKIDALVDASGNVTSMSLVSGPPLLQQAAMDALRHWKYEPAQLDGKPVPMHLTVMVQFKLQ
jgi:TonB family protein